MDRFVTRAKAYLIPKIEETDEANIYASRVESVTQVLPMRTTETLRNSCHSPGILDTGMEGAILKKTYFLVFFKKYIGQRKLSFIFFK
jgi:hypothetical protein